MTAMPCLQIIAPLDWRTFSKAETRRKLFRVVNNSRRYTTDEQAGIHS
jgi:hypothetical protein